MVFKSNGYDVTECYRVTSRVTWATLASPLFGPLLCTLPPPRLPAIRSCLFVVVVRGARSSESEIDR
jgi:hypothetical protein